MHIEVKYVPEWFPGAEFKRYAEEGRRMFEVAIDRPLGCVRESLKVSPRGHCNRPDSWANNGNKSNRSNFSIASSCLDRMGELQGQDQGFEESVIRAVTGSTYTGKKPNSYGDRAAHPD